MYERETGKEGEEEAQERASKEDKGTRDKAAHAAEHTLPR